jgi:transcription elongation factor Elf1
MPKEMEVDVERSLGYQANGRLKREKIEKSSLSIKSFQCPSCQHIEKSNKKQFGEGIECPNCGTLMIQS